MGTIERAFALNQSSTPQSPTPIGRQEAGEAHPPKVVNSSEENTHVGVGAVRQAYIAMQRALVDWEAFGDFCAAADYQAARRRWIALGGKA